MLSPKSMKRLLQFSTLFYTMLLITLTHLPLDYVVSDDLQIRTHAYWIDKLIHCVLYTGLTTLLFLWVEPIELDEVTGDIIILPGQFIVLCSYLMLLAVLDELTQPAFGRSMELLDIAADFAAIFPGASLFLMFHLMKQTTLRA